MRPCSPAPASGSRCRRADARRQDRRHRHGADAPADATAIDAQGKWVTPGIIDMHSHLGVYASPGVDATQDGNEVTAPVTADVWAEHSIWPQDPGFAPRSPAA